MTSMGWSDTLEVGVVPDWSVFGRELHQGVDRAMDAVVRQARQAGEQVEDAFDEAGEASQRSLRQVGGPATFAGVTRAADRASRQVERSFQQAASGAGRALGGLRTALKVGAAAGAASLGLLAGAAVKMGVTTMASLEQSQIAFTELLGSAEEAEKFMRGLARFAATTPFELPGLVDATRGLIGAGASAEEAMVAMKALGNASAALGLDQERFGRVMLATTQIMNKGKVSAEELMQMNEAGLPVQRMLADALGITTAELLAQGQAGELQADVVLPKLWEQMQKDYGGAMAKQSQTLNGLWSTFMDTIRIGMAQTLQPFADFLKGGLAGATATFGRAFERLPGLIQGALDQIRKSPLTGVATAWGKSLWIGLAVGVKEGEWQPFADTLKEAVTTAVGTLANITAQPVIDGLAKGLRDGDWGDFGEALGAQAAKMPMAILEAVKDVNWFQVGGEAAKIAVPFALGLVGGLLDGLIESFKDDKLGTVLAVASIIPIGRAAGLLGKLIPGIMRVPVLGGLLRIFEGAGKFLEKPLAFIGRNIIRGLQEGVGRVFPRLGSFLEGGLGRLVSRAGDQLGRLREIGAKAIIDLAAGLAQEFALVAKNAAQVVRLLLRPFAGIGRWLVSRGRALLEGLGSGIRSLWAAVSGWMASTVARLTNPFRPAAGWLVARGRQLLQGLGNGIRALWGAVTDWMATTRSRLTSPFANAGQWLVNRGKDLLSGLISGVRSFFGRIGDVVRDLKDAIVGGLKRVFGIKSPSTVMAGIGVQLVAGLVKGLLTNASTLGPIVKSISGSVLDWLGNIPGMLGKLLGFLGGAIGGAAGSWKRAISILSGLGIPFDVISTFRPGARTRASGAVSYHARNRAADLVGPDMLAIFRALVPSRPTELIYSRAPFYIARGRAKPIGQLDPVTLADHFSHVHVAYDRGGYLWPGVHPVNRTGVPERILSPTETRVWERLETTGMAAITVAPGAVQVVFNGPVDGQAIPMVQATVERAFQQLLRNLQAGVAA
jgi:tape measure domain-containing protein